MITRSILLATRSRAPKSADGSWPIVVSARAYSTACVRSPRSVLSGKRKSAAYSAKMVPFAALSRARTPSCRGFTKNRSARVLGPLWEALPDGALMHDQNAYLKSQGEIAANPHVRSAEIGGEGWELASDQTSRGRRPINLPNFPKKANRR